MTITPEMNDKPVCLPELMIDYLASPAVSAGQLKSMLVSPAHFLQKRAHESEPSKDQLIGTLIHKALLEPEEFREQVRVQDEFGTMRSPKNREKRDQWISDQGPSAICITKDQADLIDALAWAFLQHPAARNLFRGAVREHSIYFNVGGVDCRTRPDLFRLGEQPVVLDIKKCQDARPHAFNRDRAKYQYELQAAFQTKAVTELAGKPAHYIWLPIEIPSKPPYPRGCVHIAIYRADEALLELGEQKYLKALEDYVWCEQNGIWPGYHFNRGQNRYEVQDLGPMEWEMTRLEEQKEVMT